MNNTMKTVLMGALGLCVAGMLGYMSLQLVSQPVGLSSEPLTAGNTLVPPLTDAQKAQDKARAKARAKAKAKANSNPTTATTTPVVPQVPASDNNAVVPAPTNNNSGGSSHDDDHSINNGGHGGHDD